MNKSYYYYYYYYTPLKLSYESCQINLIKTNYLTTKSWTCVTESLIEFNLDFNFLVSSLKVNLFVRCLFVCCVLLSFYLPSNLIDLIKTETKKTSRKFWNEVVAKSRLVLSDSGIETKRKLNLFFRI